MFNKILVCVDPYPPGDTLLSCVIPLQECGAKEVMLAYILNVATPLGLEGLLVAQAGQEMERQQRLLEGAGFQVTVAMPRGEPSQTLHDLAEKHDASLIVLGSHCRGLIATIAVGSVSAKLLPIAHRPLLFAHATLPGKRAGEESRQLFTHILFPTDFSDSAEGAFAYLETLVKSTHCQVTLLHVQDGERRTGYLGSRAPRLPPPDAARLQRLKLWLERAGATEVGVELVHGSPGDAVVAMAKTLGCSLILMGTQGKGRTQEILLGSVAHQVVRQAQQPVLLIPALQ